MSTLLEVSDLTKTFPTKRSWTGRVIENFTAVRGVSFAVEAGSTLALVGESGAGKSTTGRLAIGMLPASSGRVVFDGRDVTALSSADRRTLRADMPIIFQDPYGSLDPRMTVVDSVTEPLLVHKRGGSPANRRRRAADLLDRVGIGSTMLDRKPYELSGGQLQRMSIARALTLNPRLIVCDEPVAALDVSVQGQVINLMRDLQAEFGLTYVFISHDLALVRTIADSVAIMKEGEIVECGPAEPIFAAPSHPYARQLLGSAPVRLEEMT